MGESEKIRKLGLVGSLGDMAGLQVSRVGRMGQDLRVGHVRRGFAKAGPITVKPCAPHTLLT